MALRISWVVFIAAVAGLGARSGDAELTDLTEAPSNGEGVIRLPLRVHLIQDIALEQKGVTMSTWVTREDFEDEVLPEINRIWKPAKIEWVLESVLEQPAAAVADREKAIEKIQNAKRNAAGKSDPERVPHLKALCGEENGHPVVNNLYLFPYIGQTSQGVAAGRGNWAIVGVWTDKPSRALKRPEKFALREKGSFRQGSIGRTCAHELGHNLGLAHPDAKTQTEFDRLMGGKRMGYELTTGEIESARETAKGRAEKVLRWAKQRE